MNKIICIYHPLENHLTKDKIQKEGKQVDCLCDQMQI